MHDRLKAAYRNPKVFQPVYNDLMHTFQQLGLGTDADTVIARILDPIYESSDLMATERTIFVELNERMVGNTSVVQILDGKLKDRAEIIYGQVSRFFAKDEEIIDWGCGDGLVTDKIYRNISRKIEGFDVRYYPAPGIIAPVCEFDGEFVPVSNGYFDAGLMTNVAHHEVDNAKILLELSRLIRKGGRLLVIETVPVSNEPEEFERTFVGDYFYNRIFHQADVSVPGTYETKEGWVRRFAEVGFEVDHMEDLGYDQPTIRDWHVLYVFGRTA
jgi:SAM-dependent methyltransferase